MAKRKSSPEKKQMPANPPKSAGDVVLHECLSKITKKTSAAYVNGCFHPDKEKMSKKQKEEFLDALFEFAALGWAFYSWTIYEDR